MYICSFHLSHFIFSLADFQYCLFSCVESVIQLLKKEGIEKYLFGVRSSFCIKETGPLSTVSYVSGVSEVLISVGKSISVLSRRNLSNHEQWSTWF